MFVLDGVLTVWPPGTGGGRRAARQWKWRRRPTAEPELRETQPLLDRVQLKPSGARKHDPKKSGTLTRRKEGRKIGVFFFFFKRAGEENKRATRSKKLVFGGELSSGVDPFLPFYGEKILQSTKLRYVRLPACVTFATRLQDIPVTHAVQCNGTSHTRIVIHSELF